MGALIKGLSVQARIYSLVILMLGIMVILAGTALQRMALIGGELTDIAKEDIPLTEMMQKITVHQLEQAILTERAITVIEVQLAGGEALEDIGPIRTAFEALAKKVDAEIIEAEELAAHAVTHAVHQETAEEFEHLLGLLKQVEKDHKKFDDMVLELFDLAAAGADADTLHALEKDIHKIEESLDKRLEDMLFELSDFTRAAADQALYDEEVGIVQIAVVSGVGLIAAAILAYLITRSIARPVGELTTAFNRMSDGDLTADRVESYFRDEIADLSEALEVFRQKSLATEQAEAQEKENQKRRARRQEELNQLVGIFGASIGGIFDLVAQSTKDMATQSRTVEADASSTLSLSNDLMEQSHRTSENAQYLSAATEEMVASIREISAQAVMSQEIATEALGETEKTTIQVQELRDAADKIGQVVELITGIAEQTNLLALNATIEAARAGEAGKGFAIVANEVKNLASQTANATSGITSHIEDIQSASSNVATAMTAIAGINGRLSESATAIASAITEQESTTEEISRNVQAVADIAGTVSERVTKVREQAENSERLSSELGDVADRLKDEAGGLSGEVDTFLGAIRSVDANEDGNQFTTYRTDLQGTIELDGRATSVTVLEISTSHVTIRPALEAPAGSLVSIRADRIPEPLTARVATKENGRTILQLPLNLDQLEAMKQMLDGMDLPRVA